MRGGLVSLLFLSLSSEIQSQIVSPTFVSETNKIEPFGTSSSSYFAYSHDAGNGCLVVQTDLEKEVIWYNLVDGQYVKAFSKQASSFTAPGLSPSNHKTQAIRVARDCSFALIGFNLGGGYNSASREIYVRLSPEGVWTGGQTGNVIYSGNTNTVNFALTHSGSVLSPSGNVFYAPAYPNKYIFETSDNGLSWTRTTIYLSSSTSSYLISSDWNDVSGGNFGSLFLDDDHLVLTSSTKQWIGVFYRNQGGTNTWLLKQELYAGGGGMPTIGGTTYFGTSLSLSPDGTKLVVSGRNYGFWFFDVSNNVLTFDKTVVRDVSKTWGWSSQTSGAHFLTNNLIAFNIQGNVRSVSDTHPPSLKKVGGGNCVDSNGVEYDSIIFQIPAVASATTEYARAKACYDHLIAFSDAASIPYPIGLFVGDLTNQPSDANCKGFWDDQAFVVAGWTDAAWSSISSQFPDVTSYGSAQTVFTGSGAVQGSLANTNAYICYSWTAVGDTATTGSFRIMKVDDATYPQEIFGPYDGSSFGYTISADSANGLLTVGSNAKDIIDPTTTDQTHLQYFIKPQCSTNSECGDAQFCIENTCVDPTCVSHYNCNSFMEANRIGRCVNDLCVDYMDGTCSSVVQCNNKINKQVAQTNMAGEKKVTYASAQVGAVKQSAQNLVNQVRAAMTDDSKLFAFVSGTMSTTFTTTLFDNYAGTDEELLAEIKQLACGDVPCTITNTASRRMLQSAGEIGVVISFDVDEATYADLLAQGAFDDPQFITDLAAATGVAESDITVVSTDTSFEVTFIVAQESTGDDPVDEAILDEVNDLSNSADSVATTVATSLGLNAGDVSVQSVDLCGDRDCNGRGTCDPNTGICQCTDPNYWGINCETLVTCLNGGIKLNSSAYCNCIYPYYDERCNSTSLVCSDGNC